MPPAIYYQDRSTTLYHGDCVDAMSTLAEDSVDLSIWSPPYFVGKNYEAHLDFHGWQSLIRNAIAAHSIILKPGAFMAVNMADILAFPDPTIPRYQADLTSTKRSAVTREDIESIKADHPEWNRRQIASALGCSEQTVQRRTENNNVRGGKTTPQTRVVPIAGMLDEYARAVGLVLYDRRVWVKDPAWANSRWHAGSYRAVDEFEYIYIFWKPGITKVDRTRLTRQEWTEWGSRGVWYFPSVRANREHEAMFPSELPRRLIRMLTDPGQTVLDPFAGNGTTLYEALAQGRKTIGAELDERYCAQMSQKLSQTTLSI